MLNKIFLMGRMTKDPELRYTQNNNSVASFTIAVDRAFGDKKTDFVNCVAWRSRAEFVSKYFKKGSMAIISGSLQSRKWEDKHGQKRTEWEVIVDTIDFGEPKKDPSADVKFEPVADDGDIPF